MKIVSACLVGINCRYDGKNNAVSKLIKESKQGKLLPLCPEQLGGLPTPRPPCGIFGGVGNDVLLGKAKVIDHQGKSYTRKFLKGAWEVLRIAKRLGVEEAILKERSPSCGVRKTWQMRRWGKGYRNRVVDGDGVLVALLRKNGIKVFSGEDF